MSAGCGVLGDVVRQPVHAGREDHRRRADPGEHLGVVAGAARQARASSGRAAGRSRSTRSMVAGSKSTGSKRASERVATVTCSAAAQALDLGGERGLGLDEHGIVGVAQVDRDRGAGGHDVDEVRPHVDAADGGHLGAAESRREVAHERGERRRDVAGIAPHAHRRGAGVGRAAGDRHLGPRDPLHALDHADRHALVLEDRSLLDVQLDVGVRGRGRRARERPGVADAHELVAEPGAVVGGADVERLLERHAADVHEAAEHVGSEAGALLVGEEGHADRVVGLDAVRLQRLDHLQAGQHAEVAVEAPAGGHGVDVRSGHHRRGVGIAPGPRGRRRCRSRRSSTARPRSRIQPTTRSRPSRSTSVSARRAQPCSPFGPSMAPISPSSCEASPQPGTVDAQVVRAHRTPRYSKAAISPNAEANAVTARVEQLGAALGGRRRWGRRSHRCRRSRSTATRTTPCPRSGRSGWRRGARGRCGGPRSCRRARGRGAAPATSRRSRRAPPCPARRPPRARPDRAARRGGRGRSSARGAVAARGWPRRPAPSCRRGR